MITTIVKQQRDPQFIAKIWCDVVDDVYVVCVCCNSTNTSNSVARGTARVKDSVAFLIASETKKQKKEKKKKRKG